MVTAGDPGLAQKGPYGHGSVDGYQTIGHFVAIPAGGSAVMDHAGHDRVERILFPVRVGLAARRRLVLATGMF